IVSEMTRATAARIGEDWDSFVEQRAAAIPVRRAGTVEDVAHAVSYLVGEQAGFVSGQVVYVAGGPKA
ncbi:MAG: SDR family oxidoreductase, partial [Actinomycetes bacterium]